MTSRAQQRCRVDPVDVDRCTAQLDQAVEHVFDALRSLGDALAQAWRASTDGGRMYESADLATLQTTVFETLDRQVAFDSAGYVLAEGTLADRNRHLDWWHRTGSDNYEFLLLNLDPDAPDCYDYYSMEWFAAAVSGQRRFVSGPLIDLPCADVYIMTFSSPVVVDDRVLGVAGADVAVARFESEIMPPLRRLPVEAVLVNRERRVIASNDTTFTTGEKLPSLPSTDDVWHTVRSVTDDLGWLLAVGRSAD